MKVKGVAIEGEKILYRNQPEIYPLSNKFKKTKGTYLNYGKPLLSILEGKSASEFVAIVLLFRDA